MRLLKLISLFIYSEKIRFSLYCLTIYLDVSYKKESNKVNENNNTREVFNIVNSVHPAWDVKIFFMSNF